MYKALLFKKLNDSRVQCLACHHYCQIAPDQTGLCGVRKNIDAELQLIVYGKAVSLSLDPIEKKPLFHFLPGTKILSFGTLGCNFACDFCQNWDISQATKSCKPDYWGQDLPPQKIVDLALEQNIPSIAYTYNEPTIFIEYALDTMKLAYTHNIKNIFVSNGFMSSRSWNLILPYLDAINIDLKSFRDDFYRKICKAKLQPVLDNIKFAYDNKVWLEVTTLVIPNHNDSTKELMQIAEFLAHISPDIPWHISAFHPSYKIADVAATSLEILERAYEIGKKAGLKYVYLGNVETDKKENTYCPKCGKLLIRRMFYETEILSLKNGKCEKCGEKISGTWYDQKSKEAKNKKTKII